MISKENAIQVDVGVPVEPRKFSRKKKQKVRIVGNVKAAQISLREDCSKGMKSKLKTASRGKKKKLHLSINKTISKENSIQLDLGSTDEPTKSSRKKKPKISYEEDVEVAQISSVQDYSKEMKNKLKTPSRSKKKKLRLSSNKTMSKVSYEDVKVVQISSGEDCSKGMKKWLHGYQKSRPGLRILLQDIDQFMTDYEAKKEQERRERDAELAKDGFQPVVHLKGRKKTTDTESGITVGSVAQAAVMNNTMKKKNKEIPVDFYRFQKREARRNEIMMLQSKFEQDKKRIQQLRAARRFRPY